MEGRVTCRYSDKGWCTVRAIFIGRGFSNPCAKCKRKSPPDSQESKRKESEMKDSQTKQKVTAKVEERRAAG